MVSKLSLGVPGKGPVVAARRYALIALRVLSIYLAVFAIRDILRNLGPLLHIKDAQTWAYLVGGFVPFIAAAVIWSSAEGIATRLSKVRPLTRAEVDALLESEPVTDSTDITAAMDIREIVGGAALVLGMFFLVYGIRDVVLNGMNLAFFRTGCTFAVGPGLFDRARPACPFWTVFTQQVLASGLAGVVSIAFGVWLIRDPLAFPERLGRLGSLITSSADVNKTGAR